jgi:hypothetical protein
MTIPVARMGKQKLIAGYARYRELSIKRPATSSYVISQTYPRSQV